MTTEEQILIELKEINRKLKGKDSLLMSFFSGFFHSIGSLAATLAIFAVGFYFLSQFDVVGQTTKWIESIMSQIDWGKIMPTPQVGNGVL